MTHKITIRSLIIGTLFAAFFALLCPYFENRKSAYFTATQIAVLPFVLLLLTVLVINPVCRFVRVVRRFSTAEILIIFIMGSVSSGISAFGLAAQLVPVITGLYNPHWNSDQSEWNRYIEPFVNENYFMSQPGIRQAAVAYREALLNQEAAEHIYDLALRYQRTRRSVAATDKELQRIKASSASAEREIQLSPAKKLHRAALRANGEAEAAWREAGKNLTMSHDEVLAVFPDEVRRFQQTTATQKTALRELETKAFVKVERFRRGLPKELRAYPGFIPLPDEDFGIYMGRVRRLLHGGAALGKLREAEKLLAAAGGTEGQRAELPEEVGSLIEAAVAKLSSLSNTDELDERKKMLHAEWNHKNDELKNTVVPELARLREHRRVAAAVDFSRLDREIERLSSRAEAISEEKIGFKQSLEHLQVQLDVTQKVAAAADELQALRQELQRPERIDTGRITDKLAAIMVTFRTFDASYQRFFIGDIPWSHWVKPLLHWTLLAALTYLILMTFNLLIFRQWAHHERLVYPLAQLPEMLAGDSKNPDGSSVPEIYRNGLFWLGVAISGGVLGWNLLVLTKVIPGLPLFPLGKHPWDGLENTVLEGLIGGLARSEVFFTVIGLAFLIPANISFSLWFFAVLYMVQLLILVWSGYGQTELSFPIDPWYTWNFRYAEGSGAMIIFALVILYKCRHYLLCFFKPATVSGLELGEQRELRVSSCLFVFGSLALILLLWLSMGANLYHTLFCYFAIMAMTVALVRAVTEGGILGFQAYASPFHFIRTFFGMDKIWTAPALFTPLLVYYLVFFFELKTFIAPAMANSIKIREDLKMERGRFHLAIFLAIAIASVTVILIHVMMGYHTGADAMSGWFYTNFPQSIYTKIASMNKLGPVDQTASHLWFGFGALLMSALLWLRQFFFWLPHPIGMIMLVNPLMKVYWFSIFLGWLAKTLVTKYGRKEAYEKARNLFVGLIAGELAIVALAMLVSYLMGIQIKIDFNR